MNRRALLIRLGLLGAAVGGGWWFKETVLWPRPRPAFPAGVPAWTPFAAPAVVPTMPGTVGGRETVVLIDSGAQYSVLDRGLHARLAADGALGMSYPLPLLAWGVGGRAQLGRATTVDVSVPGLSLPGLRTAILDLGPIAETERGLGVGLILGQDALATLVLDVDTTSARVRLSAPGALADPPGAQALDSRRAGGALKLPISVEGRPLDALVDTGASALVSLSRRSAEKVGLLDGRPLEGGSSLVLGGQVQAEVARVRTVAIGRRTFADEPVPIFGDVTAPGFPDALVGMAAFAGSIMRMDLARGALLATDAPDITVGPRRRRR
jgi:predicted aspartyl protease